MYFFHILEYNLLQSKFCPLADQICVLTAPPEEKNMLFHYDRTSADSILCYAKQLEGQTFLDIKKQYLLYRGVFDEEALTEDTNAKGQLGNFLEEYYFGNKPNSVQAADFKTAGVELKQTCIDRKKNGGYTAGERLSITNISFKEPVEHDFYKSHVWEKIRLILLVHYLRDKTIPRMLNKIMYVNLFTPPADDLSIIMEDYKKIIDKIEAGKAHELSESDTLYLGACTKGSTAATSMRPQYYGDHILAKKRNFCLKRNYMDYVLHTYVLKDAVPYERIIRDSQILKDQTFEDIILGKISRYVGKTDKQLCMIFDRIYNNNKAQWIELAYDMLGIKGNHAEEFVKANIVVKAIRLEENGNMRESMSFPPFKFMDLSTQKWEDSDVYTYFSETKFLFVVYRRLGSEYVLKGSVLWNMPAADLDGTVRKGWESVQRSINKGVRFTVDPSGKILNDLPGKQDNPIIHIRPHAARSAYRLSNGILRGNVERDANPLPDGQWMTTQSFWINNNYILEQLPQELKKKAADSF